MKRYLLAIIFLGLFAGIGQCQDNQAPAVQEQPQEAVVQPQEVSIYGEIKAVDAAANSMTIQYYDYDSDEEKSITIMMDNTTKMENAATLADIRQGNWADVIYTAAGGKNIAKSIIVEKEEEAPVVEMPAKTEESAQGTPNQ
ncbi:MAG: hypothetical protein PHI58_00385 [Candidatus Omnitrophica bacterium]|nr:hypothetical protein [Candidatus Omnitrophota bacterium]